VREEVNDLEDEIDRLEEKMRKYDRRDDTPAIGEAWGIEVVKKRVERHEKKVGEIADALNLLKKRKYLQSILRDASERAHESISDEVCSQANQRIQTLMPDNDIRIDGIDDCLRLQNQGAGSAGETLTVGYAFLSTLFNLSSYRLPFIVDSPANPIDLNIRDQVGSIVPQLANQFVAFTISSERQGFVTALQEKAEEVGQEVKFVTLFRKGVEEAEEQIGNDSPTQITEFEDGWRVEGQSFFHHFQLEREPE
jgi:DNA-binding PadR family transcriptional regulator